MGQRMPDEPIDYGTNCLHCFDADKTPESIYARFSGIEICPGDLDPTCKIPPNDRAFKLTQLNGYPCRYLYQQSGWVVSCGLWQSPPGQGWLNLQDNDWNYYFQAMFTVCPDEGIVLANDMVGCVPHDCVRGGIGVITWTPQATALLAAINLAKDKDLFMELFPREDGKLVYKFCRLKDATNIKILFEP